jgi:hypothetical protein
MHEETEAKNSWSKVYRSVYGETRLSMQARQLYTIMRGETWFPSLTAAISIRTMMKLSGWKSTDTVYHYLDELEAAGLIVPHGRGRGLTTIYDLTDRVDPAFRSSATEERRR